MHSYLHSTQHAQHHQTELRLADINRLRMYVNGKSLKILLQVGAGHGKNKKNQMF
jgi:hypothetical protein